MNAWNQNLLRRITTQGAFLGFVVLGVLGVARMAESQSCNNVETDFRSHQSMRVKIGFPSLLTTTPPRKFLVYTISDVASADADSGSICTPCAGAASYYSRLAPRAGTLSVAIDGTSSLGTLCNSNLLTFQAGSLINSHYHGNEASFHDGGSTNVARGEWGSATAHDGSCPSGSPSADSISGSVGITYSPDVGEIAKTETWSTEECPAHTIVGDVDYTSEMLDLTGSYSVSETEIFYPLFSYYFSGHRTESVTSEYTTAMLIAAAQGDLSRCPADWNQGVSYSFCVDGVQPCTTNYPERSALRHLDSDELTVTLRKFEFRFRLKTEWGVIYRINYNLLECPEGGACTNTPGGYEIIHGSGGEVTGVTNIIMPPSYNGTISLVEPVDIEIVWPPWIATSGPGSSFGGAWGNPLYSMNRASAGVATEFQSFYDALAGSAEGQAAVDYAQGGGGCSSCPGGSGSSGSGTTPGAVTYALNSLDCMWTLGPGNFEAGAGVLWITSETPSTNLSKPFALQCTVDPTVVSVSTNSGGLSELRTPLCQVNVYVTNDFDYRIQFAAKDVSGYQTNAPFVTFIIQNPNGSTNANTLRITENRGGRAIVSQFVCITNNSTNTTWELTSGNGLRGVRLTKITNAASGTLFKAYEVFNPSNSLVLYKFTEIWKAFTSGDVLVSQILDPGGLSLMSTNTYDSGGRLTQSLGPTGNWSINVYDSGGFLATNFTAFTNVGPTTNINACRVTTYGYAIANARELTNGAPRTVVESLLGAEVRRTYFSYFDGQTRQYQVTVPGAAWNDSTTLAITNKYYTNDLAKGKSRVSRQPDGTKSVWFYSTNSTSKTTVMLSGEEDPSNDTNILSGTQTISVMGLSGEPISTQTYSITNSRTSILLSSKTWSNHDLFKRPTKLTYLSGLYEGFAYDDCCAVAIFTNKDGTITTGAVDDLRRVASVVRNGITITNQYDAANRLIWTKRLASDPPEIILTRRGYDGASRLLTVTNALGEVVNMAYTNLSAGGQSVSTIRVTNSGSGPQRIEVYARDGTLLQVTGSAVSPVRYELGVVGDSGTTNAFTREIKLDGNYSDTAEVITNFTDVAGRPYKMSYADGAFSRSYYNAKGLLEKQVDPDGVTNVVQYNAQGETEYTGIDLNNNGALDTSSSDRITRTVTIATNLGGVDMIQTRTWIWNENNDPTSLLVSDQRAATDGLRNWTIRFGNSNWSQTYIAGNGARYTTNVAPDGSLAISYVLNGRLQSVTRKDSAGTQIGGVTYAYDAHGRRVSATDARNGTSVFGYDNLDRPISSTTPPPGNAQSAQTTSKTYDSLGNVIRVDLPDGASVTNEYSARGELTKTYGAREYPVSYGFDAQGRMTNITTWQNFAAGTGAAKTRWIYNSSRGWLDGKRYDDNKGPDYTYTSAGRLKTRVWARNVTTTYTNGVAGDLVGIGYSDGTSNVVFNLDRLGRRTNIVDGSGSHFFTFNESGVLLIETNASGPLTGLSVTNGYDAFWRRTSLKVRNTGTDLLTHNYLFDPAGRLTNVNDSTYSASYSYLANSSLIGQITYRENSTTRMTTSKQFDKLNRLLAVSSLPSASGAGPISFDYLYNDANQRTRATLEDNSYWRYEYDGLGQLTTGKKQWSDQSPVAGEQFEYAYDDIGNRTVAKAGGNETGGSLRSSTNTANSLNEYTQRTVPGGADVLGIANASATVKVNGASPSRKGEFFRSELSIPNSSTSVWHSVSNYATLGGTNQTNMGNLFLPKTPELFTYDADGNLTSDGRWTNRWDAENRLVEMETLSSVPTLAKLKLNFAYDWQSRRVTKIVSNWVGSAWSSVLGQRFVYDKWSLLAELNATNNGVINSFLWGFDISGGLQGAGAGGVGGLIGINNTAQGAHFAAFDGNGNVMALIAGSDGTISASYEYEPFGQALRMTGAMALSQPFGFSTKYRDIETEFYYYGYRYLSAGKWLSADPYFDRQNLSLFAFVLNNAIDFVDRLGKETYPRKKVEDGINPAKDPTISAQLDLGCVGLTMIYQQLGCGYKSMTPPEFAANTKCFLLESQAKAYKCSEDKEAFIFAKQGNWQKAPTPGPDGSVPNNSIPSPIFNYVTCLPYGKWKYAWMDNGADYGPQTVQCENWPSPTFGPFYLNEIWCVTCKCKSKRPI